MHLRMIAAIFRKDIRDAIRDSRVLVAILVPIGLGLIYNFSFNDTATTPSATVAYAAVGDTQVIDAIQTVADDSVKLTFDRMPDANAVRSAVDKGDADVGLVVPDGFDAAVKRGERPVLTVIQPPTARFGGSYIVASIDPALRLLAGQSPPARVDVKRLQAGASESQAVFERLGARSFFVLITVIMLVAMIGMLVVPVILTEETEKKTLDALVMIASYADVVAAKALVGLAYIVIAVPLLLIVTRLHPAQPLLFGAAMLLLGLMVVGFGLLIGGLFRSANQLNTWSGVMILPVIAPAFAVGFPLPGWLGTLLKAIPTSQAAHLLVNGLSGESIFPDVWLSFAVLTLWAAAAYALLLRQLSRREV